MTVRMLSLMAVLVSSSAFAQSGKPLEPGNAVPGPFRIFVAADDRFDAKNPNVRTGKMHCFICEADLNPTIAVFARSAAAADAPAVKLAGALNELVNAHRADKLGAFVAFLTLAKEYQDEDNRDKKAQDVKDVAAQAKTTGVPFGLAAGKSAATDLYGLKDSDDITVIFFDRMKVVKSWTFTADKPPTADDFKAIGDAVKAKLKK
jgi:hypothetical protein